MKKINSTKTFALMKIINRLLLLDDAPRPPASFFDFVFYF